MGAGQMPARDHLVERDRPVAAGGAVEGDHVPQIRQFAPDRGDFAELSLVGDEDRGRARVAQNVFDVFGGQRGVDRYVGAAGGQTGEVRNGPLGPVLAQNGYAVAGANPELPQAEAQVLNLVRDLRVGEVAPDAVDFGAERCGPAVRVPGDRIEEELVQRARRKDLLGTRSRGRSKD